MSDLEILIELAAADQELDTALANVSALRARVEAAFDVGARMSPLDSAYERVRNAEARRLQLLRSIDVDAMRQRQRDLLIPVVDLDREFMRALREAASEATWMPREYTANDWKSDVLDFIRNGPHPVSAGVEATRMEDMSCVGRLILLPQPDGDMCLSVVDEGGLMAGVEFCASGGQSPNTLQALRSLSRAMQADNAERPQHRRL